MAHVSDIKMGYGDGDRPPAAFGVQCGVGLISFIVLGLALATEIQKQDKAGKWILLCGAAILGLWWFLSLYEMGVFLKWMDTRPAEPHNTLNYLMAYMFICAPMAAMMLWVAQTDVVVCAFAAYTLVDAVFAPISAKWVEETARTSQHRLDTQRRLRQDEHTQAKQNMAEEDVKKSERKLAAMLTVFDAYGAGVEAIRDDLCGWMRKSEPSVWAVAAVALAAWGYVCDWPRGLAWVVVALAAGSMAMSLVSFWRHEARVRAAATALNKATENLCNLGRGAN